MVRHSVIHQERLGALRREVQGSSVVRWIQLCSSLMGKSCCFCVVAWSSLEEYSILKRKTRRAMLQLKTQNKPGFFEQNDYSGVNKCQEAPRLENHCSKGQAKSR